MKTKYTKVIMESIVREAYCWNDVCRSLGVSTIGGSEKAYLKKIANYHKLDYSHFLGKSVMRLRQLPMDLVLQNNSGFDRATVKMIILRDKLLLYECVICKQPSIWNNKPITLILDHIDGNHKNHALLNLRFVCPNCGSQLPTHAGRNITKRTKNRALGFYRRFKRLTIPYKLEVLGLGT